MDTTELRDAYRDLLAVAARHDLGAAGDGGWDADHVLAHVLSVDALVAAVALQVVAGLRPTFDNRVCLDRHNLDRIIAEQAGRGALIERVRAQSDVLCDIADGLSVAAAAVLVPCLLVSNDIPVLDQPLPLAALIGGLAENHVPAHGQQLMDLRTTDRVEV